tara:strand:+ start:541 stop:915 length:375 start_codon:yes stop_codon:yes gene_type:complete
LRKKKYSKKNESNWSIKFGNIVWELNNLNCKPNNLNTNLSLIEREYLLNNIDDFFIPITINGGDNFNLALKEIVNYHKVILEKLYNSDIKYCTVELFFKNSDLVVKKNGELIRKKVFFNQEIQW